MDGDDTEQPFEMEGVAVGGCLAGSVRPAVHLVLTTTGERVHGEMRGVPRVSGRERPLGGRPERIRVPADRPDVY